MAVRSVALSLWISSLLLWKPEAANILGLFGSTSASHLIVHMSTIKTLADRGHNITIVTTIQPKIAQHENITHVLIPLNEEIVKALDAHMEQMAKKKHSVFYDMYKMFSQMRLMMEGQYEFVKHPKLKAIYEDVNANFDLVILGHFLNDFQLGVAAKLKLPAIVSWVGVPFDFLDNLVGNDNNPAYVPSLNVALEPGQPTMNFALRTRNLLTWIFMKWNSLLVKQRMADFYNRAFGYELQFSSYEDSRKWISLLFCNYHSLSEGPVRAIMPQYIEIGGIQIKEQPDVLPADISEFLDNARTGAILFSLGSMVKQSFIEPQLLKKIFNILSSLPQRVIWKCDDLENVPGYAANILYKKWVPQDDILAHRQLQLFITHAGKGSVAEAQYHGVPMLALPVFADQPGNADMMVASGFGLSLELPSVTEQSLQASIIEVLHNPKYREKVQQFSMIYRDRPMTARKSVIYWTEYVLRHKGAYHMQSSSLKMNFVAYYNIDVYASLLVLLVILFLLSRRAINSIWHKLKDTNLDKAAKIK